MAVLLFLLLLLNSSSSMAATLSFSAELIQRDSPKSLFYNPNATNPLITSKSQSAVSFSSLYMMSLTIGDPPQKMMAIVDTGSDVTWFQCLLCTDCYPQNLPTFVPSISTTYDTIDCNTKTCDKLREHWCELDDSDDDKNNDNNVCKYKVEYADGSFTNGTLSKDLFGLETKGSNDINFPMIVFGCSRNADDRFDEEGTGLIGLDMGPLSFVSQFGVFIDWKFSHCLGRYGNPNSSGRIFFGKDAMLLGTPTPMVTKPKSAPDHELYYVNLIDISVDHKRLNIHPERFLPRSNGEGGLFLDTGTIMTYLFKDVYDQLVLKLDEKVTLSGREKDSNHLCYEGGKRDLEDGKSVPMVTLHFEGDLNVDLQPWNTFHHWFEGYVCLAIEPTSTFGRSTIGALAQQNMHVGYYIGAKMIYISPANCALL